MLEINYFTLKNYRALTLVGPRGPAGPFKYLKGLASPEDYMLLRDRSSITSPLMSNFWPFYACFLLKCHSIVTLITFNPSHWCHTSTQLILTTQLYSTRQLNSSTQLINLTHQLNSSTQVQAGRTSTLQLVCKTGRQNMQLKFKDFIFQYSIIEVVEHTVCQKTNLFWCFILDGYNSTCIIIFVTIFSAVRNPQKFLLQKVSIWSPNSTKTFRGFRTAKNMGTKMIIQVELEPSSLEHQNKLVFYYRVCSTTSIIENWKMKFALYPPQKYCFQLIWNFIFQYSIIVVVEHTVCPKPTYFDV